MYGIGGNKQDNQEFDNIMSLSDDSVLYEYFANEAMELYETEA